MAELLVVRHGQASFGADNYDKLSDLGHQQSKLAGEALRAAGWIPDRMITGTLERQKETLASMGFDGEAEEHPGLNEYDFKDILNARFRGEVPEDVRKDRRSHYQTLRDTIWEWQKAAFSGCTESWIDFSTRVEAARKFATDTDARRVLVVSSGGPIGQLVATSLDAPEPVMMTLNLQAKNTGMTKFIFNRSVFYLHEFNATPQFASADRADLLTYS
ncbi:histidine phosphatase family protein [Chachezhania antarctica]|uniref:histidine phosphatase family protein n=1 Tax=Chachezhania antarctica TaxID=2340860 RepID=UPI000EB167D4|nr:histidine phosphatase family protein [Chachezhania antarctica]|tara:strand:+ start:2092 stop:2742 length:651 start_codon:yes stop_codon:yes gene_type:complete